VAYLKGALQSPVVTYAGATLRENEDVIKVRLKRLEAARQKAEEFVAVGGDLKSKEAAPTGFGTGNRLCRPCERLWV